MNVKKWAALFLSAALIVSMLSVTVSAVANQPQQQTAENTEQTDPGSPGNASSGPVETTPPAETTSPPATTSSPEGSSPSGSGESSSQPTQQPENSPPAQEPPAPTPSETAPPPLSVPVSSTAPVTVSVASVPVVPVSQTSSEESSSEESSSEEPSSEISAGPQLPDIDSEDLSVPLVVGSNASSGVEGNRMLGVAAWVCVGLGVVIILAVLLTSRRKGPPGSIGRKRYHRGSFRSRKGRLLDDKYYRGLNKYHKR
ncbi:MAG TPA: hypothetical protein IAA58_02395 [Candidatus Gallacutalibacter stercoravium]|nr:hypothetical protein [Candidatus Gallacutalibacter stercoravium]